MIQRKAVPYRTIFSHNYWGSFCSIALPLENTYSGDDGVMSAVLHWLQRRFHLQSYWNAAVWSIRWLTIIWLDRPKVFSHRQKLELSRTASLIIDNPNIYSLPQPTRQRSACIDYFETRNSRCKARIQLYSLRHALASLATVHSTIFKEPFPRVWKVEIYNCTTTHHIVFNLLVSIVPDIIYVLNQQQAPTLQLHRAT